MKIFCPILGLFLGVVVSLAHADKHHVHHEQVHLSLGVDETEMLVTWTTLDKTDEPTLVKYGKVGEEKNHHSPAETTKFHEEKTHFFTHRAAMRKLEPETEYEYIVGTASSMNSNSSKTFKFRTLKKFAALLPRFGIVGDLGLENGRSIPYLQADAAKGMYDTVFHIGDMAYNLQERHGKQGHDYMNLMEPMASSVAYMTCPGNHESHNNFTHYDARFTMLADRAQIDPLKPVGEQVNNHFYHLNMGPAHIIMFSSEFYFYPQYYGARALELQYRWLEEDLKKANAERGERPWIIAMAHRPMYCMNCPSFEHADLRRGVRIHNNTELTHGLENLFFKYGVDLQVYGHEHHYSRTLPVYNKKLAKFNGTADHLVDAQAPIHVTTGSGGCREHHTRFTPKVDEVKYLAFHRLDYSYSRITFTDKLSLRFDTVSVDQNGTVMDSFELSKTQHLPAWFV